MSRARIFYFGGQSEAASRLLLCLRTNGCQVCSHPNQDECAGPLRADAVLLEHCDANPDEWMKWVREIRRADRTVPIILVTATGSEELAVRALRAGVQDYFSGSACNEEIASAVWQKARRREGAAEIGTEEREEKSKLIGESAPVQEMRRYMERAALSSCTVLVTGETGTGKELVAEFIHAHSQRGGKPFVCVNCAAIPESLLESELFGHARGAFTGAENMREGLLSAAEGGTVFLDEIGDMSLTAQAKILRVLEKKEVCKVGGTEKKQLDVRFVAATNQNVEAMANQGSFRKDLFFRLNVAHVRVPPLRDRREDIPLLVDHFRRRFSAEAGCPAPAFSENCLRSLQHYDWPGNIRELKNTIEGMLLGKMPERVDVEQLPAHIRKELAMPGLGADEREMLLSALFSANWNKSAAADKLRWSRMTLYRKLAKYKLSPAPANGGKRPGAA